MVCFYPESKRYSQQQQHEEGKMSEDTKTRGPEGLSAVEARMRELGITRGDMAARAGFPYSTLAGALNGYTSLPAEKRDIIDGVIEAEARGDKPIYARRWVTEQDFTPEERERLTTRNKRTLAETVSAVRRGLISEEGAYRLLKGLMAGQTVLNWSRN